MKQPPDLLATLQTAFARLKSWKGRTVAVETHVATGVGAPWPWDRHWSTCSRFVLEVELVGWFFSGNKLSVEGSAAGHPAGHQVFVDRVVAADLSDAESVVILERFGQSAERRTTFQLVAGQDP